MGTEARTRLALLGLIVVTLFSFSQVFDRGNYPGPSLLAIVLSAAVVIGARRWGLATGWTILASVVGLIWYLAVVFSFDHLFLGLPTPEALEALGRAIVNAQAKVDIDYAPVPVRAGYVILTVIGMWVATALGEIATFRWRRPLVATLPLVGLFSFLTIVGTRSGATFLVLAFLASLLTYLALESSHRLRSWGSWVTSLAERRAETPGEVASRLARRMGFSCLAAALFSPVFLPALGDGLLAWRNPAGVGPGAGLGGAASGEVDLLASLQPTLVQQSDAELFTVESPQPEYWRLASLINFDGTNWTQLENVPKEQVVDGEVISSHRALKARAIPQRVTIGALEGELLPAAAEPSTLVLTGNSDSKTEVDLFYEPETAAIELRSGVAEGLEYDVTSTVPRPSFQQLRGASVVQDASTVYTDTGPIPISPEVEQLVEEWTAQADTPFGKLRAIQDRLRDGNLFTYSEDVQTGSSTDHLTEFLIERRTGYCQQFAASFALLARYLGYPARVSVGFLPGAADLATPDRFTVRGTDAHAWPEVLFEDYGWVRFEPTPGNGAAPPGYTTPEEEFSVNNAFSDIPGGRNGEAALRIQGNQADPGRGLRGADESVRDDPEAAQQARWQETFSRLVTWLAISVLLLILLIPILKGVRTSLRYRGAHTSRDQIAAAFQDFEAEAGELAERRRPSESATAYAARMGALHRVPRSTAVKLAELYERAVYAPAEPEARLGAEARRLASTLRRDLWSGATLLGKARRLFSPIALWSRY